jgi:uncharacterized membrane protein
MTALVDPDIERIRSLNTWGTLSYVLHLVVAIGAIVPGGQFGLALLIVSLIIDLIKRDDAQGTWHASHFRWRLRSVLIAGGLYALTAPLWLLFIAPGWLAWGVISIWFAYRIIKGFIRLNQGREMYTA